MNAHPIDAEALRARAAHVYRHGGPPNAVESLAANMPGLLDLLAAAEHRIARLEARSDIRGRAVVMYRERAREAEADVKRLSWANGHAADKYATDMEELRQELDQAEARGKAVRAIHRDLYESMPGAPYCDSCDRDWPCPTIRALDGDA